ncbi:hypothetical protein GJ496_005416 [Pomphorhynchus laevis]|nr:hypothetical protein GJ496_005416 [Pomphorhynchus laevis]
MKSKLNRRQISNSNDNLSATHQALADCLDCISMLELKPNEASNELSPIYHLLKTTSINGELPKCCHINPLHKCILLAALFELYDDVKAEIDAKPLMDDITSPFKPIRDQGRGIKRSTSTTRQILARSYDNIPTICPTKNNRRSQSAHKSVQQQLNNHRTNIGFPKTVMRFDNVNMLYMIKALKLARSALRFGETPIGCILIYQNDYIVGRGVNFTNGSKNPTMHAEMVAIKEAEENFKLMNISDNKKGFADCTMYVTCEPCIMCTYALRLMNIRSCIYACSNPRFGGCGSVLDVRRIPSSSYTSELRTYVADDLFRDGSVSLLKQFYQLDNPNTVNLNVKRMKFS